MRQWLCVQAGAKDPAGLPAWQDIIGASASGLSFGFSVSSVSSACQHLTRLLPCLSLLLWLFVPMSLGASCPSYLKGTFSVAMNWILGREVTVGCWSTGWAVTRGMPRELVRTAGAPLAPPSHSKIPRPPADTCGRTFARHWFRHIVSNLPTCLSHLRLPSQGATDWLDRQKFTSHSSGGW